MVVLFNRTAPLFRQWRADYLAGFVLNVPPLRPLGQPPGPIRLHVATCVRLQPQQPAGDAAGSWVCASERAEAERWAAENRPGAAFVPCQQCLTRTRARVAPHRVAARAA